MLMDSNGLCCSFTHAWNWISIDEECSSRLSAKVKRKGEKGCEKNQEEPSGANDSSCMCGCV